MPHSFVDRGTIGYDRTADMHRLDNSFVDRHSRRHGAKQSWKNTTFRKGDQPPRKSPFIGDAKNIGKSNVDDSENESPPNVELENLKFSEERDFFISKSATNSEYEFLLQRQNDISSMHGQLIKFPAENAAHYEKKPLRRGKEKSVMHGKREFFSQPHSSSKFAHCLGSSVESLTNSESEFLRQRRHGHGRDRAGVREQILGVPVDKAPPCEKKPVPQRQEKSVRHGKMEFFSQPHSSSKFAHCIESSVESPTNSESEFLLQRRRGREHDMANVREQISSVPVENVTHYEKKRASLWGKKFVAHSKKKHGSYSYAHNLSKTLTSELESPVESPTNSEREFLLRRHNDMSNLRGGAVIDRPVGSAPRCENESLPHSQHSSPREHIPMLGPDLPNDGTEPYSHSQRNLSHVHVPMLDMPVRSPTNSEREFLLKRQHSLTLATTPILVTDISSDFESQTKPTFATDANVSDKDHDKSTISFPSIPTLPISDRTTFSQQTNEAPPENRNRLSSIRQEVPSKHARGGDSTHSATSVLHHELQEATNAEENSSTRPGSEITESTESIRELQSQRGDGRVFPLDKELEARCEIRTDTAPHKINKHVSAITAHGNTEGSCEGKSNVTNSGGGELIGAQLAPAAPQPVYNEECPRDIENTKADGRTN